MPRLATWPYGIALMAAVMLVPAAARINAAPLDLSAVPADAKWLMHFDMDAARSSVVMRRGWEQMLKKNPQAGAMMDVVSQMVGMDPRKDLRDVTAYGIDTVKRNGVMIVRAKTNRDFLTRMVEKATDYKTMNHGDYTLHAWTHNRDGHSGPMVAAFHKDDVMVFARTEAAVKSALEVLDGRQAAVTGNTGLAGRVRPGSIVVARATAVDPGTKCPVLKQAQGFRVALGEHEGESFLRVRMDMTAPAAADDVVNVIKGFSSLAGLQWGGEPDVTKVVTKLAGNAKTVVDGATVTISWDADVEDVWTVVERACDSVEIRTQLGQLDGQDRQDCQDCDKGGDSEAEAPLREEEF